jgi:signal transduction histidine kinase
MPREIAAGRSPGSPLAYPLESRASTGRRRVVGGLIARVASLGASVPRGWRLGATALAGVAAAAAVGYVTALNPLASPSGVAVEFRVLMIGTLMAAGLYGQTNEGQARMGGLLVAAGLYSSLWLLNGSSDRILFTIGLLCAGLAPTLFAYLMLVHPAGRLRSATERRFLLWTGGALAVFWLAVIAMSQQPALKTPLMQCAPHCQPSVLSLGSAPDAVAVVKAAIVATWLAMTCGTVVLVGRNFTAASAPLRSALLPVLWAAIACAALLVAYLLLLAVASGAAATVGALYVAVGLAIPLAILVGLSAERLFMGRALARFVNQLATSASADPQTLMAQALGDPSLKIAYPRPRGGTYVDSAGQTIQGVPSDAALVWIERDRRPVAAVLYNAALADQERFVEAAGAALLMRLEQTRAEADLKATVAELTASRARTMEMADAERRRLERDLHDGVQQQLVGLRIKLELATETVTEDPSLGKRALASVGRQVDDVLQSVRSLARGIYPSLLTERGLAEALKSAARSTPAPVVVRSIGIGRYAEEVEVAVYFSCVEALQNVLKHAGPDADCTVTLRQDGTRLCFEVRDFGIGFDHGGVRRGNGLVNMRDRVEAVGGALTVTSSMGHGTSVWGSVPVSFSSEVPGSV